MRLPHLGPEGVLELGHAAPVLGRGLNPVEYHPRQLEGWVLLMRHPAAAEMRPWRTVHPTLPVPRCAALGRLRASGLLRDQRSERSAGRHEGASVQRARDAGRVPGDRDGAEPPIALAPNGHEPLELLPRGQALHRAKLRAGQGASRCSPSHRLAHGRLVVGPPRLSEIRTGQQDPEERRLVEATDRGGARPPAGLVASSKHRRACAFRPPPSRVSCHRSDAVVVEASDRFLVAAAQAGDLHAFEALVRRHQGAVYRVALRMLGSEVDAEDAAQEALVQAWRGLSTFRGESAFSTWLYRVVTNRCLKARAAGHPREALADVLIDRDSDPAEALGQSERLHALARAVLVLPAGQRAALVLRELEGLSYEQIAQA